MLAEVEMLVEEDLDLLAGEGRDRSARKLLKARASLPDKMSYLDAAVESKLARAKFRTVK